MIEHDVAAVVGPTTVAEAVETMRASAARDAAVAFMGGGTERGLGYPLERVDLFVKLERLCRIVDYAPADMTITVEAGMTLGALQRVLAAEGQRLALDAPRREFATLGGLLATNSFGPRRARFGTLRDLIVGITIVRADGVLVRGGGKVVKNVAGFDLPKVMVGSLGTLGMIATATFRLHPLPESRRWYVSRGRTAAGVSAERVAFLDRQLEPAAVVAVDEPGGYALYALFEGFGPGVDAQGRALGSQFEVAGEHEAPVADEATRTYGDVRVRISVPPAAFVALDRDVLGPLRAAYDHHRIVAYPTVGIAFASGYAADPVGLALALEGARAAAETLGGNLVVTECADPLVRDRVDPFGTLPSSFPIMQRLKERFDPKRRLNRGRFVGRL